MVIVQPILKMRKGTVMSVTWDIIPPNVCRNW